LRKVVFPHKSESIHMAWVNYPKQCQILSDYRASRLNVPAGNLWRGPRRAKDWNFLGGSCSECHSHAALARVGGSFRGKQSAGLGKSSHVLDRHLPVQISRMLSGQTSLSMLAKALFEHDPHLPMLSNAKCTVDVFSCSS
jgi:hypothetical protein